MPKNQSTVSKGEQREMWKIIIFVLMTSALIGNFIRLLLKPMYAARKGRQVDVRVLSCEEKISIDGEAHETTDYYEITVDFYDLNGATLVKTLPSAKPYVPGDVIRCRYVDKTGLLLPESSPELQAGLKRAVLGFVIFFFVFIGIVAAMLWGMQGLKDPSENATIVFGYFISVLFMAVGVLGIYKKVKRSQNAHNMLSFLGVQVDYTVGTSKDSEGTETDIYYPVYEYDWGGEKRRLSSNIGSSGKKYRTIGRQVQILVNPQTREAICKEDEKAGDVIFLIFGIVGLATLALMLALSFGILPKNVGSRREETSQSSAQVNTEKAAVLELYYTYEDMEREICCYNINIYEDGSGRVLLFPIKTVSDRGIDQEIKFTVSADDLEKVIRWVQRTDVESLTPGAHRTEETDAYVSLQIYEGEERYYGGGYCDEGIYADVNELIRKVVPADVWKEMEKQETEYYQK